jgi:hypothetical protein
MHDFCNLLGIRDAFGSATAILREGFANIHRTLYFFQA